MRVTENMKANQSLRDFDSLRSQHLKASEEASTGKKINRPSDNAAGAARLSRTSRQESQNTAIAGSLSLGKSDLELAESTLASASDLIKRAKEIALTAANGTSSAAVRTSAAEEIGGIRSALLGLANTKGVRGYLFSGSQTDTPAFDSSYAFQGDNYEHTIRSGLSSEVTVSASGARAFTAAGGRDVFQDLTDLYNAMSTNNLTGIQNTLTNLDTDHEQITLERARTGVNLDRVEQSDSIITASNYLLESQKSDVGGADMATSLTKLTGLEQALTRSLTVSQRLLSLDAFSKLA